MQLVTIIAAQSVCSNVLKSIEEIGIKGYSYHAVDGVGEHGRHIGIAEGLGNTKIEIVCTAHTADEIVQLLRNDFLPHNSIIVYVTETKVLRHQKFV